jgi:hypothetical protein
MFPPSGVHGCFRRKKSERAKKGVDKGCRRLYKKPMNGIQNSIMALKANLGELEAEYEQERNRLLKAIAVLEGSGEPGDSPAKLMASVRGDSANGVIKSQRALCMEYARKHKDLGPFSSEQVEEYGNAHYPDFMAKLKPNSIGNTLVKLFGMEKLARPGAGLYQLP